MATKKIELGVDVNDHGSTQKVEQSIDSLHEAFKAFRKEVQGLGRDLGKIGGTPGSRKVAGIKEQVIEHGRSRGVAALTGAAGRDFANQAQGLGGLVRLYATYAANVFALGAAFRSLSEAMDTANMVKGLDQLGAASGRNLGGLSKRVTELAGGAISLREAMTAVAQTSSGGMNAKNIERLTVVARGASAALGVAMPDAMSRLARGITKLEPELLDELGIMTRLEPAMQAYARELKKAASQLTDFERRQAFANAVLLEGEMKFGAITDISTNPYDRLLSSIKDVVQTGASLVNKFLAPTISMLASSPTALGAGIAAVTALIVKQALPALGEFRDGLARSADTAAETAKRRVKDAQNATNDLVHLYTTEKEAIADIEIQAQHDLSLKLEKLREKTQGKRTAAEIIASKSTIAEVSAGELAAAERQADKFERKGHQEKADLSREVIASIKKQAVAEREYQEGLKKSVELLVEKEKKSATSVIGLTNRLAIEAETAAIKKQIISNAAYNASIIGLRNAKVLFTAEVKKSGIQLTTFQLQLLSLRAGVASVTAVMGTLTNAVLKLTNVFAVIGVVTAVFSGLEYAFSNNAEAAKEFDAAIEAADSSLRNIKATLESLAKHNNRPTIQGISSIAHAFDDAANSAENLVKKAKEKITASQGVFDRLIQSFLSVADKDTVSVLAKDLSGIIQGVLDLVKDSAFEESSAKVFKEALGINKLTEGEIRTAVTRMSSAAREGLVAATLSQAALISNVDSRLQSFKTNTTAATRVYQQFIQTTSEQSAIFRAGAAIENLAASMFEMTQKTGFGIAEMNATMLELANDPNLGSLFGREFILQLIEMKDEFIKQDEAIAAYQTRLHEVNKDLGKLKGANKFPIDSPSRDFLEQYGTDKQKDAVATLKKLSKEKAEIEGNITLISEAQAQKARTTFISGMNIAFAKGADLIEKSLGQAAEKGAIAIGRATLAGLSGERRARTENDLARRDIEIQLRMIDTNIDLILSNELLTATLNEVAASNFLLAGHADRKTAEQLQPLREAAEAATIFKNLLERAVDPTAANALKEATSENVAARVGVQGIGPGQRIAAQRENRKLVEAQLAAQGITGAIGVKSGQLEDTRKQLDLEGQLVQSTLARANTLNTITGITSRQASIQQAALEKSALLNKQAVELAIINTTIANAQIAGSRDEVAIQEGFKLVIQSRHEQELIANTLANSQKVLVATNEQLLREFELQKAINNEQYVAGTTRVEALNAENMAFSQLLSMGAGFTALQTYIIGNQKIELDYVKAIGDATLDYTAKEQRAREQINALDPALDADRIHDVNKELSRQAGITQTIINNAKSNLTAQQRILDIQKHAGREQARYNRLLDNSTEIATSLSDAFGDVGSSIGKMIESFGKLAVNTDKGNKALTEAIFKRDEYKKTAKEGDSELIALDQEVALQRQKNVQNELMGYATLAGASKQLFDEQSSAYQILAAIEKAVHLAHVAMTLKQMFLDTTATQVSLGNNASRMAGDTAEAEVSGVKAVVKTIASLPFPANLAAGAAIAGVIGVLLASIGGSSGKVPSVAGGNTAADTQSTQGTGRRFIDGKLQDTDFGALGASTEKVTDIADSLALIEESTSLTSGFGQKSLAALHAIEANTKQLAAAVLSSTNVGSLASGFGTVEKKAGTGSTGLLSGLLPSTSKSVEIIDKGIQVIGKFSDVISGAAKFSEFETIQTTKTKSGILGIGGKTKIKISEKTKELSDAAREAVELLFTNLADTSIIASREILGSANEGIQNVLKDFVVNFKTSGMGLSGAEFAEALAAESNVIMNEIVAKAFPELSEFRKLGEGFTGTLIRIANTMDVAGEKLRMQGVSLEGIITDNVLLNAKFYNSLVEGAGGLEAFVEQNDYFFDNFFTEGEQLKANTDEVVSALQRFVAEGILTEAQLITLTDGVGNARLEYRQLIEAQDLSTVAGINATNVLNKFAPAVVNVTDEIVSSITRISDVIENAGLGADTFSSLLNDAIMGKLEAEEIGSTVAEIIKEGFFKALSSAFIDEISNSIVTSMITPLLSGVLSGTAAQAASATAVQDVVGKAEALAGMLSNPTFRLALNTVSASVTKVVSALNLNAKSVENTFSTLRIEEYISEINDLTKELEERRLDKVIEEEQKRLDLLEDQASVLEDSAGSFKEFSKNFKDFKDSLLIGAASPLTPLEQYSTSRQQLVALYQTAVSATNNEDRTAALEKIQDASSSFLDASRLAYSSGAQYVTDFQYVQDILADLITNTSTQATIDEQLLAAMKTEISNSERMIEATRAQIDALDEGNRTTVQIEARLVELNGLLSAEYTRAKETIGAGFNTLDTNIDGLLTIQELKDSGLATDDLIAQYLGAVDSNGDQQISRIEALTNSSDGVVYTLQSIIPIFDAINAGIISLNSGVTQLGTFSGSYSPSGGGFGASNGSAAFFAPSGESVSVGMAKSQIMDFVSQVDSGSRSARELYNKLVSFGASSKNVAEVLGVSQQDVLTWFRQHDSSIPAFAKGTNNVPEDMFAYLHQGERVIPEADNRELMQAVNTNADLVVEIRKLNQKIDVLEQAIIEGAVLNAEATERNTQEISRTVKDTSTNAQYTETLRKRAQIV